MNKSLRGMHLKQFSFYRKIAHEVCSLVKTRHVAIPVFFRSYTC